MWYVYVLYDDNHLYIGLSSNLKQRFKQHKQGKVHTTKRFNLSKLKLIFYEAFPSKLDAARREKYLKSSKGRKTLKLMLKSYFSNQ